MYCVTPTGLYRIMDENDPSLARNSIKETCFNILIDFNNN